MKEKGNSSNTHKQEPKPKGKKKKPMGPATRAWMVQERLFQDLIATF